MLQKEYLFEELKMSSKLVRDIVNHKDSLKALVGDFYSLENIQKRAASKNHALEARNILVDVLNQQYGDVVVSNATQLNIESLQHPNTFTITTGHQLNLMGGHLYYIYKIAQIINVAKELNSRADGNKYVPIFWMATEDHDFAEINHINLFNQKITWEKQSPHDEVTGRISTEGLNQELQKIESLFQDDSVLAKVRELTHIYKSTKNLAQASRLLVNHLFGEHGIVVIDGDDPKLKSLFKQYMLLEVNEEVGFKTVTATNQYLEKELYHEQVHVRECNLFYIDEHNVRHRIVKESSQFNINGKHFSRKEIAAEIEEFPERFSPNALYRPLYQEVVLPNLAYIGGGGEIAYWLQLKALFEAQGIEMPLIQLRDSILIVDSNQKELLDNLDLSLLDIKLGVDQIIKEITLSTSKEELHIDLGPLEQMRTTILEQGEKINPGLKGMIEAEFSKISKSIEKIEAKLMKEEKGKHDQLHNKLIKVREKFFPQGGFQERHENFIPYYTKYPDFTSKILSILIPENEAKIRLIEL